MSAEYNTTFSPQALVVLVPKYHTRCIRDGLTVLPRAGGSPMPVDVCQPSANQETGRLVDNPRSFLSYLVLLHLSVHFCHSCPVCHCNIKISVPHGKVPRAWRPTMVRGRPDDAPRLSYLAFDPALQKHQASDWSLQVASCTFLLRVLFRGLLAGQ